MLKKTSTSVLLFFMLLSSATAQKAFETVDIAISSDAILFGDTILKSWSASPRASFELRTPYYKGQLESGVRFIRYNEQDFTNSGFNSIFVFIGWNLPIQVSDHISVAPGFRFGNHFLQQDHQREYYSDRASDPFVFHEDESEFSYEFLLRTKIDLSDRWSLFGTFSYNRTLLHIPFSVTYATAGVSGRFTMPQWLQKIVQ